MSATTIAIAFWVFYGLDRGWQTVLNLLALRRTGQNLGSQERLEALARRSPNFADAEAVQAALAYSRDRQRFSVVRRCYSVLLLVALLASGILPWWQEVMHARFGQGLVAGLLLLIVPSLALSLLAMPLSLCSTFVLEARHGFNRQTFGGWVKDRLKGLVLGAAIGLPMLCATLALMARFPDWWWAALWVFFTVFQLLMMLIVPRFIMPLFNKFEPLPEGELRDGILELCARSGFGAREVEVMDGSRRSGHSNAFFTGFGPSRKVVLFDTLVEQLETRPLLAVVAHELGHYAKRHIQRGIAIAILTSGAMLFALWWLRGQTAVFAAAGLTPGNAAILLLAQYCAGAFTNWFGPLGAWLSRRHEYQADRYAREMLGEAEPMVQALQTLEAENKSNPDPHPLRHAWNASHPLIRQRVERLREEQAAA